MGWLGWTEAQTLETSMPAIVLAQEGRVEMIRNVLKAIYGEPAPPPEPPQPADGAAVMEAFRVAFRQADGKPPQSMVRA